MALVSSTSSVRPVAFASRSTSAMGSGASQRMSTTRMAIPARSSRRATRRLIGTPLPQVTIVRSVPSP